MGMLSHQQIAKMTGLDLEKVKELAAEIDVIVSE